VQLRRRKITREGLSVCDFVDEQQRAERAGYSLSPSQQPKNGRPHLKYDVITAAFVYVQRSAPGSKNIMYTLCVTPVSAHDCGRLQSPYNLIYCRLSFKMDFLTL
jgi:hypothetical protein